MPTLKQAQQAREENGDTLQALGAHAISVDEIGKKGSKNFGVIVFVEKLTNAMPKELSVTLENKTIKVPVVIKVAGKFQPE